jgi:hypothetical protein
MTIETSLNNNVQSFGGGGGEVEEKYGGINSQYSKENTTYFILLNRFSVKPRPAYSTSKS